MFDRLCGCLAQGHHPSGSQLGLRSGIAALAILRSGATALPSHLAWWVLPWLPVRVCDRFLGVSEAVAARSETFTASL